MDANKARAKNGRDTIRYEIKKGKSEKKCHRSRWQTKEQANMTMLF